jgi:photosystem II stability/assembly factor-like uncharacterized protein
VPRAAFAVLAVIASYVVYPASAERIAAAGGVVDGPHAAGPDRAIVALAFDASRSALIEASAGGLAVSANGGRDWQPLAISATAARGPIAALAVSGGAHPEYYVAGSAFGVMRSSDGGRTWTPANDGLPGRDVTSLTAHAAQPGTVYAYLPGRGIFRSEDAGGHWRLMDAGPREAIVQFVHSDMPGSMQTGWLFAATAKGVGRSMDCFCGWRDAGALGSATRAVAYDRKDTKRVYTADTARLFVSSDGGEHWSRAPSAPADITALLGTPDGLLLAGTRDGDVYISADQGTTWRDAAGARVAASSRFGASSIADASALAVEGRGIYATDCASCHGTRGEGAPDWQHPDRDGEMPAPPHDASGHTWKHSDAMLYRLVEQGWRDPFNKTDRLTMPAFKDALAPKQIIAVISYLKTLWSPGERKFQVDESRGHPFPAASP